SARIEGWPIKGAFTISRGAKTEAVTVVAEISRGGHTGRGECVPYARYGETPEAALAAILSLQERLRERLSRETLQRALPAAAAGVTLVEQPLPAGQDEVLARIRRPVAVCADESVHDRASLEGLRERYDAINIKLDKTGGLTEALAIADAAQALGFEIMVGCMVAT